MVYIRSPTPPRPRPIPTPAHKDIADVERGGVQECGRESAAAGLEEEARVRCRIGIAAGPVVAGVLGRLQPRFHVVGEVCEREEER